MTIIRKRFDFSPGIFRLFANFRSVAVKDTSFTIVLLAKFELSVRASNKTCLSVILR